MTSRLIPVLGPDEIVARYEKVSTLGKGAFGKAYLIKDVRSGVSYVLKQIGASRKSGNDDSAAREASLLSTLDHPNIVKFNDAFWTTGGRLCLVMTYCDAGDLHSLLKRQNGELLPERICLQMFAQLAFAVKHIHCRRIIHRDLKTSNVFLMSNGLIKLGDFGISRILDRTKELARTMVGTPYYLSPEILAEQGYGFKSDIWSLGVVLYEMTTLKHPFDAGNLHSLALRIMKGDFEDPDATLYSRETRLLIRSMLKQLPEARPNVKMIIGAPVMQKPIALVVAKYPELQCSLDQENEDLDETVMPINGQLVPVVEESVLLGSVHEVVETFDDLSKEEDLSNESTVKYSVEDACYSEDFEAYSSDSQPSTYREHDSIDDLSNPAGIFNYISNRLGETRATLLFDMIQRRIEDGGDDAVGFKDEARQLLPDSTSEDIDHVLPLAEAAVFLQNAYNSFN